MSAGVSSSLTSPHSQWYAGTQLRSVVTFRSCKDARCEPRIPREPDGLQHALSHGRTRRGGTLVELVLDDGAGNGTDNARDHDEWRHAGERGPQQDSDDHDG